MKPGERAEAIIKEWEGVTPSDWNWYQFKNMHRDIEQSIIAAVEEERAACKQLAIDVQKLSDRQIDEVQNEEEKSFFNGQRQGAARVAARIERRGRT